MTNYLSSETGVMLYVDDVVAERDFWSQLGFAITNNPEIMGFESFSMRISDEANTVFTVYAKAFIAQVSPEVLNNVPSVLFTARDLDSLHANVAKLTTTVSAITDQPFRNFNFASPSGIYFAVKAE